MEIIKSAINMRSARCRLTSPVALVPTLGALHSGHEALLRHAKAQAGSVVASLFINPTQFGSGEDYETYPADREADLAFLTKHGSDIVFAPDVDEMYQIGESTRVDPGPIAHVLEGKYRPGHLLGVATIVSKLFAIIRPDTAFFGEKDAQQLVIVKQIAKDLGFGVKVIPVATIRESDGLAISSRNQYLGPDDRQAAVVLFSALGKARSLWESGKHEPEILRQQVRKVIAAESRAKLEYVSVADPMSLREIDHVQESVLISLAAFVGRTRLIDNLTLTS